jgi:hypothetical protein
VRFYTKVHDAYCGIDRHARTMYVCIVSRDGEILLHRHMPTTPEIFLKAIAPHRQDLVVAVECLLTWDLAGRPVRPRRDYICAGARPGP